MTYETDTYKAVWLLCTTEHTSNGMLALTIQLEIKQGIAQLYAAAQCKCRKHETKY